MNMVKSVMEWVVPIMDGSLLLSGLVAVKEIDVYKRCCP